MSDDRRRFEDLTLAQLPGQFVKSPVRTWRALRVVLRSSSGSVRILAASPPPARRRAARAWPRRMRIRSLNVDQARLLLYVAAVVCALFGNSLLRGTVDTEQNRGDAAGIDTSFLWLGFFIWLLAEWVGHGARLKAWWRDLDRLSKFCWLARLAPLLMGLASVRLLVDSMTAPAESALALVQATIGWLGLGVLLWLLIELGRGWLRRRAAQSTVDIEPAGPVEAPLRRRIGRGRIALVILAAAASALVWFNTGGNTIAPPTIILWLVSAALWALAFAPLDWHFFDWATGRIDAARRINWRRHRWALMAFALIMLLGMGFRLAQLESHPPEMNSDLVEKIRDSYLVSEGEYRIFFSNNGGREPLQFYLMSLLGGLPGLGFNHFTLKLLTVIEGLVTLPILVMVGVELMGGRRRGFGLLVGLLLAALVAVSYWHAALSRLGLRIVLTPLFTSLLLIYLARAMRYNRRADYIKAALALGFGLYAYQAVRMLPVAVVVGVMMAMVIRRISWRERLMHLVNLAALVFVAFMVFLPLFHYSLEEPEHYWSRTSGRILGDNVGADERIDAFNANIPILMSNIRNALLMFHWRGDVIWLHGLPLAPAMDMYSGAFLILGLAAWAARMLKSRDPVLWFAPVMIFIMLLPSALAIAFPGENPSHTRTSGALPLVYLAAALPMAVIFCRLRRVFAGRGGLMLAAAFCGGVILLANQQNTRLYFDRYPDAYIKSAYPYSEAGAALRGFADSGGAYGNAFIFAYPWWWDHRAVGIEAGQLLWPNSIFSPSALPQFLDEARRRTGPFKLNPSRDLLFFYSPDDEAAPERLREWFPSGYEQRVQSSHPEDSYFLYRVPFLGKIGLEAFFNQH